VVEIVDVVAIGVGKRGKHSHVQPSSSASVAAARGLQGLRVSAAEPSLAADSARPASTGKRAPPTDCSAQSTFHAGLFSR
jgi:hypothetical protein